MDSYSDIIATYERIMTLIEHGNYHFHIKGSNIPYEYISYDEFINMLPNIEYIDNDDPNYARIYLNPFTRNVLLVCARKQYADGKLMLIRVPTTLINTVFSLMEEGIRSEYQSTLAVVLRRVDELNQVEDSDMIQTNERSVEVDETYPEH